MDYLKEVCFISDLRVIVISEPKSLHQKVRFLEKIEFIKYFYGNKLLNNILAYIYTLLLNFL